MRRHAMLLLIAFTALTVGCDDPVEPAVEADTLPDPDGAGPDPDVGPTADTGPVVDMAPTADMAPPTPDMAPGDDMSPPVDDMAPPTDDMAVEADMGEVDAAPLNPDAFFISDAGPDDPDAAPEVDGGPAPDAGPPPDLENFCAPCDDAGDCAALGGEAQCAELIGGNGCLPGCADNDDCPGGFFCLESRCTPGGARCDSCVLEGCPGDQQCNEFTGECSDRAGQCGNCREDVNCADGLACRPLGFGRSCLADCEGGEECPEGFECTEGTCTPAAGFCDPCGGSCVGDRPVCDFISRECVQCAAGTPCPEGNICDDEGTCVEPPPGVECNTNLDCRDEGQPFCEDDACLACRNDGDCDVGEACNDGACEAGDACERVTCQAGAECAEGICVGNDGQPACGDDGDCDGDLVCNPATGQCYAPNQLCDHDTRSAVCHPGAECVPNPINANENVCTCARRDPNDFQEPNEEHRIPCQPGGTCIQLGPDPGACVSFGM